MDSLVLVDSNRELLDEIGNKFLVNERLTDFDTMLQDETIDAVHLVTPPATHAPLSVRALNASKHCACTIPMGMSIDELYQVIEARKKSGKHYMFMETSVCGREFLYVKELYERVSWEKSSSCAVPIIRTWKAGRNTGWDSRR